MAALIDRDRRDEFGVGSVSFATCRDTPRSFPSTLSRASWFVFPSFVSTDTEEAPENGGTSNEEEDEDGDESKEGDMDVDGADEDTDEEGEDASVGAKVALSA